MITEQIKKEISQILLVTTSCVIAMALVLFLIMGVSMFMFTPRDNGGSDMVEWVHYRMYEQLFANDPFVNEVVDKCIEKGSQTSKVYCVADAVASSTEYVTRHDKKHKSPSDFVNTGGVCRDYAATYCTIFKRLDIECNYIKRSEKGKEHILAYVWADDELCTLNNDYLRCD